MKVRLSWRCLTEGIQHSKQMFGHFGGCISGISTQGLFYLLVSAHHTQLEGSGEVEVIDWGWACRGSRCERSPPQQPRSKACDSARLPGQRVLLADQHFCSVDFELVFSGYGSPTEVLNVCPILSILGNPLVNELKSYFVILDTSPRRRCVAGAYVRCVYLFS